MADDQPQRIPLAERKPHPDQAARDAQWRDENREKIEAWNAWVEDHGLPLEKGRVW
jgi:hypothetical protein